MLGLSSALVGTVTLLILSKILRTFLFLFFIHHTESSEMGLDSLFLVGVELRVLDFYVVVLYMVATNSAI